MKGVASPFRDSDLVAACRGTDSNTPDSRSPADHHGKQLQRAFIYLDFFPPAEVGMRLQQEAI